MKTKRQCKYCSKVFYENHSDPAVFCSRPCADADKRKDKIYKSCIVCKQKFYINKNKTRNTCSRKCTNITYKKPRKTVTCIGCGIRFTRDRHKSNKKYCSHECFLKYKPIARVSKVEKLLIKRIQSEYKIRLKHPYVYMGFVYDAKYKNLLIESDGSYWHKSNFSRRNDELKDFTALDSGMSIIRFSIDVPKDIDILFEQSRPILDKIFNKNHV